MFKNIIERIQLERLLRSNTANKDNANFGSYSPTYIATNENQRAVLQNLNVEDKDVLCVTASGDFALNALSMGAKKIVTFDINEFAAYVLDLKIATIKTYPEVSQYASFWSSESPDFLSYAKFLEIKKNLRGLSFEFWYYAYACLKSNNATLKNTDFFRNITGSSIIYQTNYNLYFNQNYYDRLRKSVIASEIDNYYLDIAKINVLKSDYQFDVIYLSNILQYYSTINGLDSKEKVYAFLETVKKNLLRENGTLVASYNFFNNLLDFTDNPSSDIRDATNYLILKDPEAYKLVNVPSFFSVSDDAFDDGICLSRKR